MSAWVPPEGTWAVRPTDVAVLDNCSAQAFEPLLSSTSPLIACPKSPFPTTRSAPPESVGSGENHDRDPNQLLLLNFNTAHDLVSIPFSTFQPGNRARGNADAALGASDTQRSPADYVVDAVAFAGGAVWCADFCPPPRGVPLHSFVPTASSSSVHSASTSSATVATLAGVGDPSLDDATGLGPAAVEYVAIGAHNPGGGTNLTNVVLRGPGAVQLWALPHGNAAPECPLVSCVDISNAHHATWALYLLKLCCNLEVFERGSQFNS